MKFKYVVQEETLSYVIDFIDVILAILVIHQLGHHCLLPAASGDAAGTGLPHCCAACTRAR